MDPNATAPGAATSLDEKRQVPLLALVILWSKSQPHRVGEVAFLPIYEELFVGRWEKEVGKIEKFARFARRRVGEVLAADPREDVLTGKTLSREQLKVCATAVAIEVENVGKCVMLVNGVEMKNARLEPGDVLRLKGELVLLCVRRVAELPSLRPGTFIPAFGEPDAAGIIGESAVAWQLRAKLDTVAATDDNVFITGESGAGKELAAKAIHKGSSRANGTLVARNAAAFTDTLVENALFGNVADYPNKGVAARKGLLTEADGGTFFLDEIADCPDKAQAQLLRVMDANGDCQAQGSPKTIRVDVRFIGATNREGLRSELGARLPSKVHVPPFRERREDIPLLVRHWLLDRARTPPHDARRFVYTGPSGRPEVQISSRLIEYLVREPLALNVRELHALVLVAMQGSSGDKVQMPWLPGEGKTSEPPSASEGRREGTSRLPTEQEIRGCIDRERGNISRVAEVLGMERSALYRLMRALGIKWKE